MEPFIGQIILFAGSFAPRDWALCNGQLLLIRENTALFSIIGTSYGGDGVTTFALPDLRGRVPMHTGTGKGLTPRTLGELGGEEAVLLNTNQIPAHTHRGSLHATNDPAAHDDPTSSYLAGGDFYAQTAASPVSMNAASLTIDLAGGNQPHTNLQPFQCVNFIIALAGIFPSRN